jgi:uncharacterized protein YegP (UPF0339 family)
MDKVYVYKDNAKEWRWRRVSVNGNIISGSGEGYKNHLHCQEMATKLNPDAELIVAIESGDTTGLDSEEEKS